MSPINEPLRPCVTPDDALPEFGSPAYRTALRQAEKFARDSTATVLIEGEAGTGKTSIPRRLHQLSSRRQNSFRTCVLSALDDALASDELFGHLTGAFTAAREVAQLDRPQSPPQARP